MTRTVLTVAAAVLVAAWPAGRQPPNPDPRAKDAEPLPDYPKADPDVDADREPASEGARHRDSAGQEDPPRRVRRRGVPARGAAGGVPVQAGDEGARGRSLRADFDARKIHELLLLAGRQPGTPAQFVDPKTEEPEFKPATGTATEGVVHYRKDGKLHTHPAQEWVWNRAKKQKPGSADWVFAGSRCSRTRTGRRRPPFYAANSGEVIAHLELPVLDARRAGRDQQGRRQPELRGEDRPHPAAVVEGVGDPGAGGGEEVVPSFEFKVSS